MVKAEYKEVKGSMADLMKELEKMADDIQEFDGKSATVGIHEEEGAQVHPNSDTGEKVIDIAAANHFGFTTPEGFDVPARPFVSQYIDKNESKIKKEAENILKKSIKKLGQGKEVDIDQDMEDIAEYMEKGMKEYIDQKPFIPNAPMTVEKKGFDFPLVETGKLTDSIKGKAGK